MLTQFTDAYICSTRGRWDLIVMQPCHNPFVRLFPRLYVLPSSDYTIVDQTGVQCYPFVSIRMWCNGSGVGVTWAPFFNFSIKEISDQAKNTCLLLRITFIFVVCHHRWAAATHGKYERYIQQVIIVLSMAKIVKITERKEICLVTPNSDLGQYGRCRFFLSLSYTKLTYLLRSAKLW